MPDHVVYVDRFRIREGKVDDFARYAAEMAAFVEADEPGALLYGLYLADDGRGGTAVFVFADAEALDRHLDLASARFQEGVDLLETAEIELLGRVERPSDVADLVHA